MSRFYQIHEDDLATLEREVPQICDALTIVMTNEEFRRRHSVKWRAVQEILSNVRWGYGPPQEVGVIPAGEDR